MGSPETPHFPLFPLSAAPPVHRSSFTTQQLPPKSIPTHDRDIDRYAIAGFVLLVLGVVMIVLAARTRRASQGAELALPDTSDGPPESAEPGVTPSPAVERLKRDVRRWKSPGSD